MRVRRRTERRHIPPSRPRGAASVAAGGVRSSRDKVAAAAPRCPLISSKDRPTVWARAMSLAARSRPACRTTPARQPARTWLAAKITVRRDAHGAVDARTRWRSAIAAPRTRSGRTSRASTATPSPHLVMAQRRSPWSSAVAPSVCRPVRCCGHSWRDPAWPAARARRPRTRRSASRRSTARLEAVEGHDRWRWPHERLVGGGVFDRACSPVRRDALQKRESGGCALSARQEGGSTTNDDGDLSQTTLAPIRNDGTLDLSVDGAAGS